MAKSKVVSIDEAMSRITSGSTLMLGGFLDVGTPLKCIEWLLDKGTKGEIKDLTLIANGAGMPGGGFGKTKLYPTGMIKEFIGTHIGTAPESTEEYVNDRMMLRQFFPMGTWVEKVRAGGLGLGGILTKVGVGVLDQPGLFPHAEPKQIINLNGVDYFLEPALRAPVSIVKAWRADELGNLEYRYLGKHANPYVALASDFCIAEVNEIVPVGTIKPQDVGTPAPIVDAIVQSYTTEEQDKLYRDMWLSRGKLKA